jgi:hypothetical protein
MKRKCKDCGEVRPMTVTPDKKHGGVDVTCSVCGWYYGWLMGRVK